MKTIGRNEPCWCGSGRKYKQCHGHFDEKLKELEDKGHIIPPRDIIKTTTTGRTTISENADSSKRRRPEKPAPFAYEYPYAEGNRQ